MPRCLISLGANLGDALATIQQAARELGQLIGCSPTDCQLSRFFHTPPVGGPPGQPPFVNAVLALTTLHSPWEVWQAVRDVEQHFGRRRVRRWEARPIDLDILLYDDVRIWTPQFKIPHPRMCMRRFILEPAMDVAADWIDPVSKWSVQQLAQRLRASRANLLVFGDWRSQTLLAQVAQGAVASWCNFQPQTPVPESSTADPPPLTAIEGPSQSRWVGWLPMDCLKQRVGKIEILPAPKLIVFLADMDADSSAQWEDLHAGLARSLNLKIQHEPVPSWSLDGARYLLATHDQQWAVHEMIAALEAMDCPVEVIA